MVEKIAKLHNTPRSCETTDAVTENQAGQKAPTLQFLLLLYLAVLSFILGMGWPWPYDPDIWWHLKTGEWILSQGAVPWVDPFGANTQGERWIAYSWLAEVLFYAADRASPSLGLHLLQGLVVAATTAVLFVHARAVSGSLRLALLLSVFFLVPVMPWTARPQIFSFLFVALTMLVLWHREHKNRNVQWILPPLLALWANIHIYFIIGLGLVFLALCAPWVRWLKGGRNGQPPRLVGLAVLLLSVLAPLLNPYGYHLYQEVFALARHGAAGWAADSIVELASPDFHDWPMKIFFGWVMLTVLAFVSSGSRTGGITLLLFAGLLYQSLLHRRDMPYFVIVMLPVLAYHLAGVANLRWQRFVAAGKAFPAFGLMPRIPALIHLVLGLGAVAAVIFPFYRLGAFSPAELEQRQDSFGVGKATEFLARHQLPGPLYHSLDWGGYLIHRLAPAYKVYIDGRTQLYGRNFWESHNDVRHGKPDWYAKLTASGARTVLWKKGEPLASLLRLVPAWEVVYEDEKAIIFVKKSAAR